LNIRYGGFGLNIGGAMITRNAEAVEAINAEIKDQYAIINLKLSYTVNNFPASVYLDVRNALDTRYQEILGSQMPGRWIMGGIRWNFNRTKFNPMQVVPIN
jgi:iron complex outermembrane receptor protein